MDQCSPARHPTSTTGPLTKPPGHDLVIDLRPRARDLQSAHRQPARTTACRKACCCSPIRDYVHRPPHPRPHRVRKKDRVDRRAGAIVTVWPKVRVRVERLARGCVTETCLHDIRSVLEHQWLPSAWVFSVGGLIAETGDVLIEEISITQTPGFTDARLLGVGTDALRTWFLLTDEYTLTNT
jgi:hypothetical protein